MTTFDLYLLTRLPEVKGFFEVSGAISLIVFIISVISFFVSFEGKHDEKVHPDAARYTIWILATTVLLFVVSILIPNKEEIAIIFVGDWITNNEVAKKLPDDAVNALHNWLIEKSK